LGADEESTDAGTSPREFLENFSMAMLVFYATECAVRYPFSSVLTIPVLYVLTVASATNIFHQTKQNHQNLFDTCPW
jgi:hypothetical protein